MSIRTLARVALGYVAAVESMAALVRFRERSSAFRLAVDRAGALGRPLVVIGDPDGGMHTRLMRAYGCGDVCVDMNGCPRCPVTVVADITKGPIPNIPDDSAVVFVSCVLEYVTDLQAALAEIARIAGKPENVFIVTVQPWTLTSRLYPGAHWRGSASEAQGGHTVSMAPVHLEEKLATTLGLGVLAATAFWPRGK
jgi:SAM-dependent methyltransferase